MQTGDVDAASRRKPGLGVLIALAAFGPAALNIFLPSMPGLQAALNIDNATAQLTLTVYLGALAIGQLFVGPLSDRYGRRPVALGGILLFTVATFFCSQAGTITELLIARVFQATGGCAGMALSRAVVRDMYGRDKAASWIGYVTMAMVTIPMLAPVFGAYLDEWAGWKAGFYFMTGWGVVTFIVVWNGLHETHHNHFASMDLRSIFGNIKKLLGEPAFLGYAMNSSCGAGVFFAFLAGAPFVMVQTFGLTPSVFGIYFITTSFGYMLGNYLSGRYAETAGANRMILIGTWLMLVGLALLVLMSFARLEHPVGIFLPMFIIALANGVSIPSAMASAISVRPEITGTGAGIVGFLQFGVGMIATWLVGIAHGDTSVAMVMVMVGCGICAFLAMVVALRASRHLEIR